MRMEQDISHGDIDESLLDATQPNIDAVVQVVRTKSDGKGRLEARDERPRGGGHPEVGERLGFGLLRVESGLYGSVGNDNKENMR